MKRTVYIKIFLLSIFLFINFKSNSQPMKSEVQMPNGESVSSVNLEQHIKSIMDSINMPGLSIAFINNNELVYSNDFGVANYATKSPVNENSIFEGASLSKPVFAYFVMKMAEEGVLVLDKPLYQYLEHPGIDEVSKEEYKLITARMVLAHQTGFPNHSNGEPIELAFKPGTDFKYSGEAYQYLLAVIGTIKGTGWEEEFNIIFEDKVMKPLGMNHTSFLWNDNFEKQKVYGHKDGVPTDNGLGGWNGKNFISYASIHSRADDYAKFLIAMLTSDGLNQESFKEMLNEETKFKDDNPLKLEIGQTGWGLGFAQKRTENGTMHMHTGNNHDFQAYCMFLPEAKYGIVAFTNSDKMQSFITALSQAIGPQF